MPQVGIYKYVKVESPELHILYVPEANLYVYTSNCTILLCPITICIIECTIGTSSKTMKLIFNQHVSNWSRRHLSKGNVPNMSQIERDSIDMELKVRRELKQLDQYDHLSRMEKFTMKPGKTLTKRYEALYYIGVFWMCGFLIIYHEITNEGLCRHRLSGVMGN